MTKVVPKFSGKFIIKDKQLAGVLDAPTSYQRYVNTNFKEGHRFNLIVKRYIASRTTGKGKGTPDEESNQNGYLWGIVYPIISQSTGMEIGDIHDFIKVKFLPKPSKLDPDVIVGGSTAKLNKLEWEELMLKIRIWALDDLQIKIPEPNEASGIDEE